MPSPSLRQLAVPALICLWLLTGSLSSSVLAAGHAASIVDGAFTPRRITIKHGDSVTWTNRGSEVHNVYFDAFHSNDLRSGASYSHKFTKAGSFTYVCTIHGFNGTVVVKGPAATPTVAPTPTPTAAPTPTTAPAVASPSPTLATPALSPLASPSPPGAVGAQDSGGAGSSSLPLVLVGVLVVAGVLVGLALNRGRR